MKNLPPEATDLVAEVSRMISKLPDKERAYVVSVIDALLLEQQEDEEKAKKLESEGLPTSGNRA